MMQRRPAVGVGRIQRALVLDQQVDHGYGADGGGAVEGVLASFVADAGGGRSVLVGVGEELAGYVEVVFGGYEVDHGLYICIYIYMFCQIHFGFLNTCR